jgi:hypothetical protein
LDGRQLSFADEEREAALGCDQLGCDWEDRFESLDCAQGYYIDA